MHHAPRAGSIARPIDQQSNMCYGRSLNVPHIQTHSNYHKILEQEAKTANPLLVPTRKNRNKIKVKRKDRALQGYLERLYRKTERHRKQTLHRFTRLPKLNLLLHSTNQTVPGEKQKGTISNIRNASSIAVVVALVKHSQIWPVGSSVKHRSNVYECMSGT